MVSILISITRILANVAAHLFRRGRGIFKFLFFIDDFIRLFTMTILTPMFFSWLGFQGYIITLATVLGIVIDLHDIISDYGIGKTETIG